MKFRIRNFGEYAPDRQPIVEADLLSLVGEGGAPLPVRFIAENALGGIDVCLPGELKFYIKDGVDGSKIVRQDLTDYRKPGKIEGGG